MSSLAPYGYDADFVHDVSDDLKCFICQYVLKQPVQHMACGHRFCLSCFNEMKRYSTQSNTELICPIDRDVIDLSRVFEDKGIDRTIKSLEVRCKYSEGGCCWKGSLGDVDEHYLRCEHHWKVVVEEINPSISNEDEPVKQVIERILKCEKSSIAKEKELTLFKYSVKEMKEEIKDLQGKNDALNAEIENLQTIIGKDPLKDEKNNHIVRYKQHVFILIFSVLAFFTLRFVTKKNEEIMLLTNHLRNIEHKLFIDDHHYYHNNNNRDSKKVKFHWTLQNYNYHFEKGDNVDSPPFFTQVSGYRFQLQVRWTGKDKQNLEMYLHISRGENDGGLIHQLPSYNHEFELRVIGRKDHSKTIKISHSDIETSSDLFKIHDNKNEPDRPGYGRTVFVWPEQKDYIINDSMQFECIVFV